MANFNSDVSWPEGSVGCFWPCLTGCFVALILSITFSKTSEPAVRENSPGLVSSGWSSRSCKSYSAAIPASRMAMSGAQGGWTSNVKYVKAWRPLIHPVTMEEWDLNRARMPDLTSSCLKGGLSNPCQSFPCQHWINSTPFRIPKSSPVISKKGTFWHCYFFASNRLPFLHVLFVFFGTQCSSGLAKLFPPPQCFFEQNSSSSFQCHNLRTGKSA